MPTQLETEKIILDFILDFKIKEVPSETRFWMIRTKKGYFYHEFISKQFVALAWNSITSVTNFSTAHSEALNDSILLEYPEIKRPTLVANKCKSFIHDIKEGDILVIPNNGSQLITFAYAGSYYEENSKTPELEQNIIRRIEHGEVLIDEVSCPYKKRRHIVPIRTVKSDELNYHLYKAISSYHGISNFDDYGTIILDHIYNYYTFLDNTRLVFHVSKTSPITSKEFSGFLYSINSILSSTGIDEHALSTQASVHSVGDIVFNIKNLYTWLSDNYLFLVAIVVALGGGKFLTVELPGIPKIIKDILSINVAHKKEKAELRGLKLDNMKKQLEIREKIASLNISVDELTVPIDTLSTCSKSMEIKPIENISEPPIAVSEKIVPSDNEEEAL